jgi:hypothetical protein
MVMLTPEISQLMCVTVTCNSIIRIIISSKRHCSCCESLCCTSSDCFLLVLHLPHCIRWFEISAFLSQSSRHQSLCKDVPVGLGRS